MFWFRIKKNNFLLRTLICGHAGLNYIWTGQACANKHVQSALAQLVECKTGDHRLLNEDSL